MSIEQVDVVDTIHVDNQSDEVILTISDHLKWNEGEGDHLLLLQEKLNTYLRFVESGEILQQYPKASGRKIVISVIGKYPVSESGQQFYNRAASIIEGAGMKLHFKQFGGKF